MMIKQHNLDKFSLNLNSDFLDNSMKEFVASKLYGMAKKREKPENRDAAGYLFLYDICVQEGAILDEVPFIFSDFIRREGKNIAKYKPYATNWNPSKCVCSFEDGTALYLLSIIYSAVKEGCEYAKSVFKQLYKKYFAKEYKVLKRYSFIKASEIGELSEGSPFAIARILCMAEIMGIELVESDLLSTFFWALNDTLLLLKEHTESAQDQTEDMSDAENRVKELFGEREEWVKKFNRLEKVQIKMIENEFVANGYIKEFAHMILPETSLPETLVLAAKRFTDLKKNDFTSKQLADAALITMLLNEYITMGEYFNTLIPCILARDTVEDTEPSECKKIPCKEVRQVKEQPLSSQDASDETEDLKEQIAQLQKSLAQAKSNEVKYCELWRKEKNARAKIEYDAATAADEHDELLALRNYVYSLPQGEMTPDIPRVSVEEMTEYLMDKKICIVGGHPNWVKKFGQFKKWKFFDCAGSSSVDYLRSLIGATEVFFFTDILSHKAYNRAIGICREHNIPFSYLNGIQVEKNIEDIYEAVKKLQ